MLPQTTLSLKRKAGPWAGRSKEVAAEILRTSEMTTAIDLDVITMSSSLPESVIPVLIDRFLPEIRKIYCPLPDLSSPWFFPKNREGIASQQASWDHRHGVGSKSLSKRPIEHCFSNRLKVLGEIEADMGRKKGKFSKTGKSIFLHTASDFNLTLMYLLRFTFLNIF